MQELHLVGFTTDLEQLIFSVRKGAKSGGYTVGLDEQLLTVIAEAVRMRRAVGAEVSTAAAAVEAAVREGKPAGAAKAESALTPREIQARLRAGRTVKQVAKAAGVSEAWIERFAAPVRGEQGQMAARARSLVFSKPRLGESAEPLGLSVRWNVAEKGVRFTEQEFEERWSAYQFQDHVWVIRFVFESRKREQVAEWILDLETDELTHRNRLASDLGYLEPGKRRKVADLVPEPADLKDDAAGSDDDDDHKGPTTRGATRRPVTKKATARKSPARRSTGKKAARKKAATKKASGKKAAARKSTTKKTAAKKTTAKKTAGKKTAAKKAASKKAAARKTAKAAKTSTANPASGRKSAAKNAAPRKSAATKAGAKKATAERAAPKKAAAKNATARKTTKAGGRRTTPAARRSEPARPPAAQSASDQGSPWRPMTAGATMPANLTPQATRVGRPSGGPPPSDTRGPGPDSVPSQAEEAAMPAPDVATPAPAGAEERSSRRAARRARAEAPAGDDREAPPESVAGGAGQVVTIRANRATPPLADRPASEQRRAPEDVEEGVLTEPRPLRPAIQARPPRRRRYGNRG